MERSQAEIAIFIFLGVFCVLCPLFVFICWYCFGDDDRVEIQYVKKPKDRSKNPSKDPIKSPKEESHDHGVIKQKGSHLEIMIEDTGTSSEESEKTTVEVSVCVGDEEEGCFCNTPKNDVGTPKPKEIVCVQEVSAGGGATSRKVATIDVHRCTSSYCQLCKPDQKATQFIAAEPLEGSTAYRMRHLPNRWWEIGTPLRDLTASVSGVFSGQGVEEEDDDDASLFSKWSRKVRKKRPKTPRTSGAGLKVYYEGRGGDA